MVNHAIRFQPPQLSRVLLAPPLTASVLIPSMALPCGCPWWLQNGLCWGRAQCPARL